MITVVGVPIWRDAEPGGPAGRACDVALAVAARGASVELVGRVGDDPAGDALLLALARAGVGHAAVLRDPARSTPVVVASTDDLDVDLLEDDRAGQARVTDGPRLEPADIALGLRYLTSFAVLVVTDDVQPEGWPAAIEAAAFAAAHLVLLVPAGAPAPDRLPPDSTVLAAPDPGDDGEFAAMVAAYATAIAAGVEPAQAFATATGTLGWEALEPAH